MEQNGNAILKAAFEPLNHSKVNLFSPEYNEACTPIGYELTRGDAYQVQYFKNININLTTIILINSIIYRKVIPLAPIN